MKHYLWIGMLSLVSGISWAQCTNGTSGTNCSGPLSVQPQSGNTGQSAIILVDLGLPVPAPAGGQYTLSIAGGILQESDNGNHSLVGPPGPQGLKGATGPAGPQGTQGPQGLTGAAGPCRFDRGAGRARCCGTPGATRAGWSFSRSPRLHPLLWDRVQNGCGYERSRGFAESRSDRYVEHDHGPFRDHDRDSLSAERKLCSGRVHARRNELVCTVGRSTRDHAQRNLFERLAGPADRSEWRLRGPYCREQRRYQLHPGWAPPVAFAVQVGRDPAKPIG